jgi:hypothetical protein
MDFSAHRISQNIAKAIESAWAMAIVRVILFVGLRVLDGADQQHD